MTALLLSIITLLLASPIAQASTSNLSVFSGEPVELNSEVSQNLIRLSELSRDLTDKNAQIDQYQNHKQEIENQISLKQDELGEQLKLVYTSKPLLSSLSILLNSKTYNDVENALTVIDYLANRTYKGLNQNVASYNNLVQEHDQIIKLQQTQQEVVDQIKQNMELLEDKGVLPRSQQLNVPDEIKYRDISPYYPQLIDWLNQWGSKEASEEYLSIINAAGHVWGVDPLLLLAITGQEQVFVPANDSDSEKIINNPWNVFHSWQEFQAGFGISAMWAANTVARLSQNSPGGSDIIRWINGFSGNEVTATISNDGVEANGENSILGENNADVANNNPITVTSVTVTGAVRDNPAWGYADDPNWWVGVSQYYGQLKDLCQSPPE